MMLRRDRLGAVTSVVNVYRMIKELLTLAPPPHERVWLGKPIERPDGVTVLVGGKTAVKTVPFAFFRAQGTSAETVQMAHKCANSCASLVHNSSTQVMTAQKKDFLKVVMTKLGYPRAQLSSEEDKKSAVRCCLLALEHLHSHGLLHCDVRLLNVLWGPEPFLADLELAHMDPWKAPAENLINWENASRPDADGNVTEGTLDAHGNYTCMSDIFQVGVMLEALKPSSDAGNEFAAGLKAKQWTAAQALRQPYLAG